MDFRDSQAGSNPFNWHLSSPLDGDQRLADYDPAREHTLAGKLIAAVRNTISGAPADSAEAARRADQNETFAESAADTLAMLPLGKSPQIASAVAGGIRAALLFDSDSGLGPNAINALEGSALHGIGRFGLGLSADTARTSKALFSFAEATRLFEFGAGTGAVKSLFNEGSWRDEKGQFSASRAIGCTLEASLVGGVIGVPAGYVGTRLVSGSLAQALVPYMPARLAGTVLTAGSGYAAGAVSGAADAALRGGGVQEVLESANKSGLIGLATGGLGGAVTGHLHLAAQQERLPSAAKEQAEPPLELASPKSVEATPHVDLTSQVERVWSAYHQAANREENSPQIDEYKSGRAVSKALSSIEPGDRFSVWSSLLDRSRSPQSADRQLEVVLGRALRELPELERQTAWRKLAELGTKIHDRTLASTIDALPKENRLDALLLMMDRNPNALMFTRSYSEVAPQDLPRLAEKLYKMPTDETIENFKTRMNPLLELPNWAGHDQTQELSIKERTEIAAGVLAAGFKYGVFGDEQPLHNFWVKIPEEREPHVLPGMGQIVSHAIKGELAQRFEERDLAKALFSWSDPALVDKFVQSNPGAVRDMAAQPFKQIEGPQQIMNIESVLKNWDLNRSFTDLIKNDVYHIHYTPGDINTLLIGELGKRSSRSDQIAALTLLKDRFIFGVNERMEDGHYDLPRTGLGIATILARSEPQLVEEHYTRPIEEFLSGDGTASYEQRLLKANLVAYMQRSGHMDAIQFKLPDLRMPKVETGLSPAELVSLRTDVEASLASPDAMRQLLGDGPLGKLLPKIFGHYQSDGGIVGRPQHETHDYPLDEHLMEVARKSAEHPAFASLAPKYQTDLLWASFLHDVAKRAGVVDQGHEWASGNIAWGVLRTLGYAPVRIQRIANLISRGGELSYHPEEKVSKSLESGGWKLDELATFFKHPAAVDQLRIMNESDIRSVHRDSKWWSPEVAQELDSIHDIVKARVAELNRFAVPILTSEQPHQFKLVLMDKPYSSLVHVSREKSFLDQLSVIESPEFAMSSSLSTQAHRKYYHNEASVVAIVTGPAENVSQAWRQNLGTGYGADWKKHVRLTTSWAGEESRGATFAEELDARIRKAGLSAPEGNLSALSELRERVYYYDSLDEFMHAEGADSPYVRAYQQIHTAMTSDELGREAAGHNEAKLVNPTVVGIGIIRENEQRAKRSVLLEDLTDSQVMAKLLDGEPRPAWLLAGAAPSAGSLQSTLVVPQEIWKAALARDLPLVVLDP